MYKIPKHVCLKLSANVKNACLTYAVFIIIWNKRKNICISTKVWHQSTTLALFYYVTQFRVEYFFFCIHCLTEQTVKYLICMAIIFEKSNNIMHVALEQHSNNLSINAT